MYFQLQSRMLEYYQKNKVVLKTDITTGQNNGTPTGNYKVIKKARNTYLRKQSMRTETFLPKRTHHFVTALNSRKRSHFSALILTRAWITDGTAIRI